MAMLVPAQKQGSILDLVSPMLQWPTCPPSEPLEPYLPLCLRTEHFLSPATIRPTAEWPGVAWVLGHLSSHSAQLAAVTGNWSLRTNGSSGTATVSGLALHGFAGAPQSCRFLDLQEVCPWGCYSDHWHKVS